MIINENIVCYIYIDTLNSLFSTLYKSIKSNICFSHILTHVFKVYYFYLSNYAKERKLGVFSLGKQDHVKQMDSNSCGIFALLVCTLSHTNNILIYTVFIPSGFTCIYIYKLYTNHHFSRNLVQTTL